MAEAQNASAEGREKEFTIIVNAREKTVTDRELSFEQVVALGFPTAPYGANTAYTVTYRRGHGNKPEGILVAGQGVQVKDRMIFDVTATDKS